MVLKKAEPFNARWALRDWIAAAVLFAAAVAVILWQNTHVAVLWDLSYVLDTSARIAAGQIPYRGFPLVHAPLTFLMQAGIISLTGHVYFHHVLYCAAVGATSTVLAWRLVLQSLRGRSRRAWLSALLLAAPLAVLGIYCIFPFPSYDCDCAFWILVAIAALLRLDNLPGSSARRELARGTAAGILLCVPLFFKQNMGLPFLAATLGAVIMLAFFRPSAPADAGRTLRFAGAIAGAIVALLAAALVLQGTVGLGNYLHWTIGFAAQRRLPAWSAMAGVYSYPSLLWILPCVALGIVIIRSSAAKKGWLQAVAFVLIAAPFLFTLASLLLYDDADDCGDTLLELWPLLLIIAAALALVRLIRDRRVLTLRTLLPFVLLIAINGTMMSQQLWGSTYAIWPLVVLLLAEMIVFLDVLETRWLAPAMTITIGVTLLLCGGFYTASEDRLSYAQFPAGPVAHSAFPQLAGMATPGPYLPEFDELLRYAAANIPPEQGVVLIPGEEPFFFATGRSPRFPITLFDPTTDPYSPEATAALARSRGIRWLIVKRDLQINADPTPQRAATMNALLCEYTLTAQLSGYDVYRLNRDYSDGSGK